MSNQQAAALRTEINQLALQLEAETGRAARRCLKLAIRSREFQLSGLS